MAAANESQGLKIAVAVFVSLTVMLAVSTYFAYTYYAQAEAKLVASESKLQNAIKEADSSNQRALNLSKDQIGARSEDAEEVKKEIKNSYKKIDDEIKSLVDQVNEMVTQAQAKGAQGPELEDAKAKVQQVAAAYRSEPNKTFMSAMDRLTELLKNLSMLTTQLSLNFVDVKRNLESTNNVNDQKLKVEQESVSKAKTDLTDEQKKHVDERQLLLTKVDQYQTDNAKLANDIANLTAKLRKLEDDYTKNLALAQQNVRDWRDRVEREETVLERPDGQVTFVDYGRGEIHANLTRGTGVRPQWKFSIFDAGSPGLPTDKPKATVEIISVGERESIARIIKTNRSIDPIRVGDHVYSPAWSPNEPMRFALIGKMDVNQDGRDDRADLKRMIESAGGIVDYDLPPPEAGKESGKLTGNDAWYVIDERKPFHQVYGTKGVTASENSRFLKQQSEAIREARLVGVRPLKLERLLAYLGYDFAAPVQGRAESVDVQTLKRVLTPRQNLNKPKADAPADAAKEEEMPKEDAK